MTRIDSSKTVASLVVTICLFALATGLSAQTSQNAVATLTTYFEMLETGNYESAAYMWAPASQERAARFGITYDDIVLKADCNSPIVRDLAVMRYHLQPPAKGTTRMNDHWYRLEFRTVVDTEKVEHSYYMFFDDQYYWLAYPQDYFCEGWPITETKYFRIHYHPDRARYLNPVSLAETDRFVEILADSLDLSKDDLKMLEEGKIEYYFADRDETVQQITGFLIKGTYDMASGDIISAFFPHNHEITHLLIDFKLRELPLYTLPIMRSGAAVYHAGRWGKAPNTLMELGAYLLEYEIIELDSILTMKGFKRHSGSDIAYPVAGLFSAFLMEETNRWDYLDLYRDLSGPFDSLNGMTEQQVQQVFVKAIKADSWSDLEKKFNEFCQERITEKAVVLPGAIDGGKSILKEDQFEIRSDKNWVSFECWGKPAQPVAGNILFDPVGDLANAGSSMFEEQYPQEFVFEGFRFGVRYDQNEVGLYDYATNYLMAKYIWGISPSEEYYDSTQNQISVRFRKELFNGQLPSGDSFKLLPR